MALSFTFEWFVWLKYLARSQFIVSKLIADDFSSILTNQCNITATEYRIIVKHWVIEYVAQYFFFVLYNQKCLQKKESWVIFYKKKCLFLTRDRLRIKVSPTFLIENQIIHYFNYFFNSLNTFGRSTAAYPNALKR